VGRERPGVDGATSALWANLVTFFFGDIFFTCLECVFRGSHEGKRPASGGSQIDEELVRYYNLEGRCLQESRASIHWELIFGCFTSRKEGRKEMYNLRRSHWGTYGNCTDIQVASYICYRHLPGPIGSNTIQALRTAWVSRNEQSRREPELLNNIISCWKKPLDRVEQSQYVARVFRQTHHPLPWRHHTTQEVVVREDHILAFQHRITLENVA
jgi:hypothetical protein